MVMDRDFAPGLGSEKPEAVFWLTVFVFAGFGQPANTDALDVIEFASVRELFHLDFFNILGVQNFHDLLPFFMMRFSLPYYSVWRFAAYSCFH
jgi:hypothetical protein